MLSEFSNRNYNNEIIKRSFHLQDYVSLTKDSAYLYPAAPPGRRHPWIKRVKNYVCVSL